MTAALTIQETVFYQLFYALWDHSPGVDLPGFPLTKENLARGHLGPYLYTHPALSEPAVAAAMLPEGRRVLLFASLDIAYPRLAIYEADFTEARIEGDPTPVRLVSDRPLSATEHHTGPLVDDELAMAALYTGMTLMAELYSDKKPRDLRVPTRYKELVAAIIAHPQVPRVPWNPEWRNPPSIYFPLLHGNLDPGLASTELPDGRILLRFPLKFRKSAEALNAVVIPAARKQFGEALYYEVGLERGGMTSGKVENDLGIMIELDALATQLNIAL